MNNIFHKINHLLEEQPRVIIAVDGHCAAGKTTLSAFFKAEYREKCTVIHMDHFFLPAELRAEARLAEPGGNIDYDRFISEVIDNLKKQETFIYNIFDCSKMSLGIKVSIPGNAALIIVEGAYSLHPKFGDYADIKIFADISSEEQEKRILKRNGHESLAQFKNKWIPMENLYFEKMNIRESCHIIVKNELTV